MDYYKSIPYLDRVINQPSIYNKLTCRDFDHLVTMLPAALFRYNYKEVDPDDFALPEYYTSADIEKAIDKVVIHLEQYIHSKLTNPDSYIRELKESLGSCYSEEMRDYWIDEIDYAPTSVMDAIIYEICYDMLWFNENKITEGYKNISLDEVMGYLTEICVIYCGFGKIMFNSSQFAIQRRFDNPSNMDLWQISYMRQKFFGASVPVKHTRRWITWAGTELASSKPQYCKVLFRLLFAMVWIGSLILINVTELYRYPRIGGVIASTFLQTMPLVFIPWRWRYVLRTFWGMFTFFLLLTSLTSLTSKKSLDTIVAQPWFMSMLLNSLIVTCIYVLMNRRKTRSPYDKQE